MNISPLNALLGSVPAVNRKQQSANYAALPIRIGVFCVSPLGGFGFGYVRCA